MPDSEKRSWLVLGHGFAEGGQEFGTLQAAASALLGDGESLTLQQKIARATVVDQRMFDGSSVQL